MVLSHSLRVLAPCMVICAASARSQQAGLPDSAPAARAALTASDITWKTKRTPHAVVHALAGSAAEKRLSADAALAEQAIVANLALLGARNAGRPLQLFLVGSRDQMRRFTGGQPHGGWSITGEGTSFLVANDSVRPALRHETMHLLSWRLWGTPGGSWLSEGLATLAVGPCQGQTVEQMTAAARTAGLFVPIDTLRYAFVNARELGVVHYAEAATLVHYIDRVYGKKKLREFWSTGGFGGVEKSLGVDVETLEKNWRESLAATSPKSSWAALWRRIDAHGCE
jgi:hypothetical protein